MLAGRVKAGMVHLVVGDGHVERIELVGEGGLGYPSKGNSSELQQLLEQLALLSIHSFAYAFDVLE